MKTVFIAILCCITLHLSGQYWEDTDQSEILKSSESRDITPLKYRSMVFDTKILRTSLDKALHEESIDPRKSSTIIRIPMPDGSERSYRIVSYDMMEKGLQEKFPNIKTYRGHEVGKPTNTVRMDWTVNGFHAMILSSEGSVFIDPIYRNNTKQYQSYFKKDFQKEEAFKCHVESEIEHEKSTSSNRRSAGSDCAFRSYRLAVAVTGEYSNYFGIDSPDNGGSATILGEVVTTMNRVNGVYEQDVAIRMILIANTTDVFYYDGSTDPYSNGSGSAMLGQNQTNLDSEIGSANYDIGHVFSTGGGGVATLRSPCRSGLKARGVTGQNIPVGDPFSIDYVAHEMGHQFGANHTQNNSCNRNSSTAMEPGSAATIMGYAGICAPNVQSNSDAYFHGISIQEIDDFITDDGDPNSQGDDCDVVLAFGNTAPNISPQGDYTIPISTPFVLTAEANDPDNDPMTFCWEQWDTEAGNMPPEAANVVGPMFRSFFATPSPSRYFPRLSDLTTGADFDWEELPSVSRNMEFRCTVRDFHNVAGCTTSDNVNVTTNDVAGPFIVSSQNAATTWLETQTATITWDVANTTAAPINCTEVDIFLSYDGGLSYPTQLAENVMNDGSQEISIPNGITTQGRVMVKAADNIFFAINEVDIEIQAGSPNFNLLAENATQEICDENSVTYAIEVESILGFSNPVTLSINGSPNGAAINFSSNPATPGTTVDVTVSNLTNAATGTYNLELMGSSTTGTKELSLTLIKNPNPGLLAPSSPANGATQISNLPILEWTGGSALQMTRVQVSENADFSNLIINELVELNNFQVAQSLNNSTIYFWRVRGENDCGISAWSQAFSFETRDCFTISSTEVPISISAQGQPVITSTIEITGNGLLDDINVTVDIEHTWAADLELKFIGPDNTEVELVNDICSDENDMQVTFDDQAAAGAIPCPPTDGLSYQPTGSLSDLNDMEINGIWTLEVADDANQDGGSLNAWSIEVCATSSCNLMVNQSTGVGTGSLAAAISCAASGDTIRFASALTGETIILDGPLSISKNVILVNSNNSQVKIQSAPDATAFVVDGSGDLHLDNLVIEGNGDFIGSAIQSNGHVLLRNTVVERGAGANELLIGNKGVLTLEGESEIINN